MTDKREVLGVLRQRFLEHDERRGRVRRSSAPMRQYLKNDALAPWYVAILEAGSGSLDEEPPVRFQRRIPLGRSDSRLITRRREAARERDKHRTGNADRNTVTPSEFPRAIN